MNRPVIHRSQASAAVGIAVAIVILAAAAAAAMGGDPAVDPSSSPPPPPTATPVATPAPVVSPSPVPTGTTGGIFDVKLDLVTPHDLVAHVTDESGAVIGASSGRAGDGMSVRWNEVKVENVDADTLRVTWVGLPADGRLPVIVAGAPERLAIAIVEPEPPANSDALGFDRVLILDFGEPVRAADVTGSVQGGLDTSD